MVGGGWAAWRRADGRGTENEDMKMEPVSQQWEMEQLSKYELSRQRCKAAVWGGGGEGASATQWSQISISETLIDTFMHKKICTHSSVLGTPPKCV